jgi:hypothetical protein
VPVTSDVNGSIHFSVDHQSHQIGIFEKTASPEIVFLTYQVNGNGLFFPDQKKECNL